MFRQKLNKISKRHQFRKAKQLSDLLAEAASNISTSSYSSISSEISSTASGNSCSEVLDNVVYNQTNNFNGPESSSNITTFEYDSQDTISIKSNDHETVNSDSSNYDVELVDNTHEELLDDTLQQNENPCTNWSSSTFPHKLSNWALIHKVPHTTLGDLLKLLKEIPSLSDLPSDARTLLRSPRDLKFKVINLGHYYHIGVKNAVHKLLKKADVDSTINCIEIYVNIDGIPLTKSSGSQLYPILCNLCMNTREVEIIGIYHGYEKPNDANEFLSDFVKEIVDLTNSGLNFNDKSYEFRIRAFTCDVPAKSFITYTTGHMGYFSCSKCCIKGEYRSNRICFPQTSDLVERTDYTFRQKDDTRHHTGTSILESIPNFDMVTGVVLDYMHLICLGTMRKLLYLWCFDTHSGSKLSRRDISKISQLLLLQKPNIPCEFVRKPRPLTEVKRWKATEFRQFLFYTGPVILKSILHGDIYTNFLSLFIACRILASPRHVHNKEIANILLKYFVESFIVLYGSKNVSHNIHNMLHISSDVGRMGVLDEFGAFPFENKLQGLKRLVRKGDKPLCQIVKRIREAENVTCDKNVQINQRFGKEHERGPLLAGTSSPQYGEINFPTFKLKTSEPDNHCGLRDGKIICVRNVVTLNEKQVIVGYEYLVKEDTFTHPCKSSCLDIFSISHPGPLKLFSVEDITFKYVKLDYADRYIVLPLLHNKDF